VIDRRGFLRVSAVSAAALAATSCRAVPAGDPALARPELLSTLGAGPVRAIGARYRTMQGAERDSEALRRAILASRPMSARLFGVAEPSLATLVREDFEQGRIVVVDGWILSVTEARQCALFSLLPA
jgi:hypothetical protein